MKRKKIHWKNSFQSKEFQMKMSLHTYGDVYMARYMVLLNGIIMTWAFKHNRVRNQLTRTAAATFYIVYDECKSYFGPYADGKPHTVTIYIKNTFIVVDFFLLRQLIRLNSFPSAACVCVLVRIGCAFVCVFTYVNENHWHWYSSVYDVIGWLVMQRTTLHSFWVVMKFEKFLNEVASPAEDIIWRAHPSSHS